MKHKTITLEVMVRLNLMISIISAVTIALATLVGFDSLKTILPDIPAFMISFLLPASILTVSMVIMNNIIVSRYNDALVAESHEFAETLFRKKVTSPEEIGELVRDLDKVSNKT